MTLATQACIPCSKNGEALDKAAAQSLLANLEGWTLQDSHKKLYKEFSFKTFKQALAFVNKVGALAEAENHHPDIALGWGYARITFQTHSIGGLHKNDFILAARVDEVK